MSEWYDESNSSRRTKKPNKQKTKLHSENSEKYDNDHSIAKPKTKLNSLYRNFFCYSNGFSFVHSFARRSGESWRCVWVREHIERICNDRLSHISEPKRDRCIIRAVDGACTQTQNTVYCLLFVWCWFTGLITLELNFLF